MSAMNVLVACEFSAIVRDAFTAVGCNALSCDLLPSEGRAGNHIIGDVRRVLDGRLPRGCYDIRTGGEPMFIKWDLLIAFPPCTFLCNSGVRWLYRKGRAANGRNAQRWSEMVAAAQFVRDLWAAPIERIGIEQPIMHGYGAERVDIPVTQTIQPHEYGHGETKATTLRLKNLPDLNPTNHVTGRSPRVHHASPSPDRWKERSRTLRGIAAAMAAQWGNWQLREVSP